MQQWFEKWRRRLPLVVYLGFAVLWLAWGLLEFAINQTGTTTSLFLTGITEEGFSYAVAGRYITEDSDPKLIFTGLDTSTRYVRLQATFSTNPHEMDLYYTTAPEEDFSVKKRAIGAPQEDGSYLYTLPPFTTVHNLRLDLGTVADNHIDIKSILLNASLPLSHFLAPNLRTVAGFAAVPTLALCAIYTIIEWYLAAQKWRARRKVKA